MFVCKNTDFSNEERAGFCWLNSVEESLACSCVNENLKAKQTDQVKANERNRDSDCIDPLKPKNGQHIISLARKQYYWNIH